MAAIHFSIGFFNNNNDNTAALVMTLSFLVVYQNTSGPLAWVYCAETCIDASLGLCLLVLWTTVLGLTLVCPTLMDEDSTFGPSNVFFTFGATSLLGTVFVYFFIRETYGLTDKAKKLLFVPKQYMHEFLS